MHLITFNIELLLQIQMKYPKNAILSNYSGGYFTSHSINFHKLPFERKRQDYRKNIFNNSLNSKQPILVFGCSFANGYLLDDKDTFSNKLSLLTKKKCL